MSNYFDRIKKYTRKFYWFLVFLITSVLLFIILPGESRFRYEYQKGTPWNHENLVAPFDFAILKKAEQIDADRQEQLKLLIPYFTYDTLMGEQKIKQLEADWLALTDPDDKEAVEVLNSLRETLFGLYEAGILPRSPETYEELTDKTELRRRIGNRVTRIPKESIYSEKAAYNELNNVLNELAEKYTNHNEDLLQLPPERYISSNLTYDSNTTTMEREEVLKNISTTQGLVQAGERIILEGEIVNDERFQVLESLKASYEAERGEGINRYMVYIGKGTLIIVFMILLFTFLFIYRFDILNQFSKLSFLLLFLVSMILLTMFINSFPRLHIYMVPFAIFPIVIHTFFDSRTAIFTLIIASLISGFYAPNNYEFVLLQVTAGMVAVFSLNKMHRRGHLIMAVIWVLLTYVIIYTALEMIFEGTLKT
jgi:cyclic-di-AMP phosphodiesterase PgpH